ncbi:complement factor H-like [Carassius auratus]|uniref:Complement factor H-like n=1 Tax=Carassius auratus TaxID=7957 RepID=A0A6P6M6D8_CARAU|nr:complement factor H-like [Carassius auratus]
MRVPVKLLGFGFWLFFLNCVRCQECLRGYIKYENTEPVEKASYADGETVKVICVTGYTGFYKLKCVKGEWKKTIERPCAKKKCNHPGDTPNGSFELTEGMEFVFGVTVMYTCKKGYEMTSSINHRTCRTEGWDNTVPVCEVVKCPAIRTDEGVTASGNTEEGSYGDVIRFECVSSDKMIDGSSEIHCQETGKWSDVVPKCKAKQKLCPDLSVENGFIHIHPSNKEKIFYSCNTGYKPFSGNWWGSVTCTKESQFEEPRCILEEECGALPSVHHGKLTLRDQETADVKCDPGFMSTERSIKCTNGRWEKPVCKEVHCDIPPNVENAVIISEPEEFYVPGSTVTYVCRSSYLMNEKSTVVCRRGTSEKPPTCQGQREITCQSNGEWSSPLYKCEETKCVAHLAENIRSDEHRGSEVSVRQGQTITLSCVKSGSALQGQSKITCQSKGEWSSAFPKCISQTTRCGPPPHVNDADTTELKKDEYTTGERVEYSCFSKYTLDLRPPFSRFLTCDQGEWRGNIKCLKPCTVTVEEMNRRGIELAYVNRQKMFAPHNDYISFACKRGKYSVGVPLRQQCNDGLMTLPECE